MSAGRQSWLFMPHAGHFICGSNCRFHLNTYVNGWIVSTVGEYLPDSAVREVLAKCRGIKLEGKGDSRERDWLSKSGFEKIGLDRLYETMVFRAVTSEYSGFSCCPKVPETGNSVDFEGYNLPGDAATGHDKMCLKWAERDVKAWFEQHPNGYEDE